MATGFRVKLEFYNVVNEFDENIKKSWIFVNKSSTRSLEDFIFQIKDKFQITKSCGIHLELEGYSLPSSEHIDILRDSDEIRVIKDNEAEQELKRPLVEEDVKIKNINASEPRNQSNTTARPYTNFISCHKASSENENSGSISLRETGVNLNKNAFSEIPVSSNVEVLFEIASETTKRHKKTQSHSVSLDGASHDNVKFASTSCDKEYSSKNGDTLNEESMSEHFEKYGDDSQAQRRRRKRRKHGKAKCDDNSHPSEELTTFENSNEREETNHSIIKKPKPNDNFESFGDQSTSFNNFKKNRNYIDKSENINEKLLTVPKLCKSTKYPKHTESKDESGRIKIFKRNQVTFQSNEASAKLLSLPPACGSIISFRMLEMSADYTPMVSDSKKAKVLDYCPASHKIQLKLLEGIREANFDGRFELTIEDQDQILTNKPPSMDEISVSWNELLEPILLSS